MVLYRRRPNSNNLLPVPLWICIKQKFALPGAVTLKPKQSYFEWMFFTEGDAIGSLVNFCERWPQSVTVRSSSSVNYNLLWRPKPWELSRGRVTPSFLLLLAMYFDKCVWERSSSLGLGETLTCHSFDLSLHQQDSKSGSKSNNCTMSIIVSRI